MIPLKLFIWLFYSLLHNFHLYPSPNNIYVTNQMLAAHTFLVVDKTGDFTYPVGYQHSHQFSTTLCNY